MGDYHCGNKVSSSAPELFDEMPECEDEENSPTKEGKGRLLWKKVKYELAEYHSLPGFMRDNEYIHRITDTATRIPQVVDLSALQQLPSELVKCLPSLPAMTALRKMQEGVRTSIPSLVNLQGLSGWNVVDFLSNCLPEQMRSSQSLYTLGQIEKDGMINMIAPLIRAPVTRWPFFAFLVGAMFCPLASSTCHLLSCHSKRVSYIMLRLDYAGIAALISTSFYPPVCYSFMCSPFFCNLYLSAITLLGIATIIFWLSPVFDQPKF